MIEIFVSGQQIRLYTPVIAADAKEYLTLHASFTDESWDGYTRWAHFRRERDDGQEGATVYDLLLDENDEITAAQGLNLTVGEWELFFTGRKDESRLTTVPVRFTVKESGLIDAPLHPMPLSVAEQLDAKIEQALAMATEVKTAADSGQFDGQSFVIGGFYNSLEALRQAVPDPETGAAYGVGTEGNYTICIWDAAHETWVDNGPARGPAGSPGAVFTPSVDAGGNLSWTNNGGLPNPAACNIRGPQGQDGARGPAGPGAYEKAVEAGYTGTEASFYSAVTAMPYHNARHLPGGADPIEVKTGNLEDGAVTAAKLAADAVSKSFTAELTAADWSGTSAPYVQQLSVTGMLAADKPILDVSMSGDYAVDAARNDAWCGIYRAVPSANKLTVYASDKPAIALPIRILCVRK